MSTDVSSLTDTAPEPSGAPSGPSPLRILLRLALVGGIIIALFYAMGPHWVRVMGWGLMDNDDAMRVLQVRDWLNGQSWFDVTQHRLAPPDGGDMHWSRLADLPLALLMAPLNMIFGPDMGAKYAAFFTPIALGVLYVWVGSRAAIALGGTKAFLPGIILMASAPAALSYFLPGRVDHHGLQMILILGAIWGMLAGTKWAAALSGVAIAGGICIGLEALPLQIVLIFWVAARWAFRGADVRSQTIGFSLGFGLALAFLFAFTVPMERWALPTNDAVGRGYVVLGLAGSLLLALAALLGSRISLLGRLVTLAVIGVCVLSGIAIFPEIIVPPYGNVDPLLTRLWLNNVNETEPLATSKLSQILFLAAFPVLAAIGALVAVMWAKEDRRDFWLLAALSIFVAAGLAVFWQSRVAGLATAVSSVMAAALVAQVSERFNWKVALGAIAILNPVVPGVAGSTIAKQFEPQNKRFVTGGGQGCYTQSSFSALQNAPKGLVIAPIDMGARVLLTTHHTVLAAPYHRNNKGNLAAYRLFMMPAAQAQGSAASLRASFVAICKRSAEVQILSREAPKGLMADLRDGRVPAWLKPLPVPKGSDVAAYQVVAP
jgi:hypothetical protein